MRSEGIEWVFDKQMQMRKGFYAVLILYGLAFLAVFYVALHFLLKLW